MTHTVMIVEDDPSINEVVSEYLKDAGYLVLSLFNGHEALDAVIASPCVPDMFIFDIMLPGVGGLELLRAVRAHERHNRKPVMMLTALNDEYTQLQSFIGLADDYVTKPFSPRILVQRVQALLRRANTSDTATAAVANGMLVTNIMSVSDEIVPEKTPNGRIEAGPVLINTEGYEAFENGERLPLTLREYELLKSLAQNHKRVLSRQQLLDAVWGYDFYGDERIVDVHIKNLRKKMRNNLIVTVKGVGYKYDF